MCTAQVLNIFEPRYREMYNDILFNGSRQFVVSIASDNPTESSFAKVGVVFYLEDLKEVSGQTDDRIKYVVQHKVSVVYTSGLPPGEYRARPARLPHPWGATNCRKAQLHMLTTEL
jgi:hypothetical protein